MYPIAKRHLYRWLDGPLTCERLDQLGAEFKANIEQILDNAYGDAMFERLSSRINDRVEKSEERLRERIDAGFEKMKERLDGADLGKQKQPRYNTRRSSLAGVALDI